MEITLNFKSKKQVLISSIMAGICIGLGGAVNATIGGVAGAIIFAVGLLAVLNYQFDLFTGKAGYTVLGEYGMGRLVAVWFGNFLGAGLIGALVQVCGRRTQLFCSEVVATRIDTPWWISIAMGFLCGLLMFAAVECWKRRKGDIGATIFVVFCVGAFILMGGQHCVADMFYVTAGATTVTDFTSIVFTTIGNYIGCILFALGSKNEYN